MMKELVGIKLKKLDFDLQKMGDLYSFEGPFLSHFRDERGFDYLMNWVDVDDFTNRWLLFRVSNDTLNKYFSKKLSLLQLILTNDIGIVHFIDIDSNADYINIWVVSINQIPKEYKPHEDSFFDPNHANRYALDLAKDNKEYLQSSKNSFMNKAVKQLFGSKARIFISHINSPWNHEPNTIDEITTVRAMYFPLLIHYHHDIHNLELRNLIHTYSQVYSNPLVCKSYLSNIRSIVLGDSSKDYIQGRVSLDQVWQEVIESTKHIVQRHPSIRPLYNDWITTLEMEYDNISVFRKHFDEVKSLSKE